MFLFQVIWDRGITADQGQKMLEAMSREVKRLGPTQSKIEIEGVTVHSDPFPEIVRVRLVSAGLEYKKINHCYQVRCETEEKAEKWQEWVRSWVDKSEFAKNIHCRTMEIVPEVADLSEF